MPWFSRKKNLPPPPEPEAPLASFRSALESRLQDEVRDLTALNIPIPRQLTDLAYTPPDPNDPKLIAKITLPTFDLPPHYLFIFRDLATRPLRRQNYTSYFITAKSQSDIEEAIALCKKDRGLSSVARRFPGFWLNRNPYFLYKMFNERPVIEDRDYWIQKKTTITASHFKVYYDEQVSPLKTVSGYSAAELDLIDRRYNMLDMLCYGCADCDLPENPYHVQALPKWITDEFIHKLPMPSLEFPRDIVRLKVLPSPNAAERLTAQFLDTLRQHKDPLSFAVIATAGKIYFQFMVSANYRAFIEQQIQIHFPEFAVIEAEPLPAGPIPFYSIGTRPRLPWLKLKTSFPLDPYSQLFSIMAQIKPQDTLCTEVLFVPVERVCITELARKLESNIGKPNNNTKEITKRSRDLQEKHQPWLTSFRIISSSPDLIENVVRNFLRQFEVPDNDWPTTNVERTDTFDLPSPHWNRWTFVSTEELAILAHFPDKTIECDRLETVSMKSKLPPDLYTQNGIEIGSSEARGITKPVVVPNQVRDRHVYVVGKSGTGKSTLLYNCICQDIEADGGVAVIDPHGDLVDEVLNYIPERRIKDTIYFNAADKQHPIGLNILNAQNEDEIGLLADDLLVTFKRLSESWGERMKNILLHTFHTLLRYDGATFLDIRPLLQRPEFREQILASIQNKTLADFWQHEYPSYPKDAAQPILNRMSKFSLSPTLSAILSQADSDLNFFDVIQNKKILLVRIPKGEIGEDTSHLLGSLIVSQLQLAVMRRASLPKEARDPYYLYVDEFQNFTTSAFEKILSEARKYNLCLTLAHQYISQVPENIKNAILANVGTILIFQSYPADAALLRPELGQYDPSDVTNLNTSLHEALCKPATQSRETFKFKTLPPLKSEQSQAAAIIDFTHENYCSEASIATPPPHTTPEVNEAASSFPIRSRKFPAKALPKEFTTAQDRILYYISQADYLSTAQIIKLCYGHVAESAKKSVASRDLKVLVESKRIKSQMFGPGKIYFLGRTCNPTTHNLAIRDLFTRIVSSEFELAEVNFSPRLKELIPDLAVDFLAEDGTLIKTFWEYDTGTEGITELVKKVARYESYSSEYLITFVLNTEQRLVQTMKTIRVPYITFAVMSEFETLHDAAFQSSLGDRNPFF